MPSREQIEAAARALATTRVKADWATLGVILRDETGTKADEYFETHKAELMGDAKAAIDAATMTRDALP